MNLFGLKKEQYQTLAVLAIEPLKNAGCRVWVFGSRATGEFQKFSDIDLLYEAPEELALSFIFKIKSALQDSDFPIKVDIVNLKNLAESYREGVLKSRIEV